MASYEDGLGPNLAIRAIVIEGPEGHYWAGIPRVPE